jgi:hypothetical protein
MINMCHHPPNCFRLKNGTSICVFWWLFAMDIWGYVTTIKTTLRKFKTVSTEYFVAYPQRASVVACSQTVLSSFRTPCFSRSTLKTTRGLLNETAPDMRTFLSNHKSGLNDANVSCHHYAKSREKYQVCIIWHSSRVQHENINGSVFTLYRTVDAINVHALHWSGVRVHLLQYQSVNIRL